MSVYINNKEYNAGVIIDKGLSNVNVTNTDIRPGKVSIDSNGNKLPAVSHEIFFTSLTNDATVIASDVTAGKTIYANGHKIVGTGSTSTENVNIRDSSNGIIKNFTVQNGQNIKAGDFVTMYGTEILLYGSHLYTTIGGIALQDGVYPDVIEVLTLPLPT